MSKPAISKREKKVKNSVDTVTGILNNGRMIRNAQGNGEGGKMKATDRVTITDAATGESSVATASEIAENNDVTLDDVAAWVADGFVGGGAAPVFRMTLAE